MSTQKLDFSSLTLEMLHTFPVAERVPPKERFVEKVEESEQKAPDVFEIRRKQFFQP
jgi:hypothetical protein